MSTSSRSDEFVAAPGAEPWRRYRPGLRYELIGCGLHGHELLGTALTRRPTAPRAGRSRCPMLLLVSTQDDLDVHGDPEAIWRPWTAGGLTARAIDSGHHQAEEAPQEVAAALRDFLAG